MKKAVAIGLAITILLSVIAFSQLAPVTTTRSSVEQVTPKITLETKNDCTTESYEEMRDIIGTCTYFSNYTSCLNTSGPNTACSQQQSTRSFSCKTGQQLVQKNKTSCFPQQKFFIEVTNIKKVSKKELDFSSFGPCIRETENNCLVITCVSSEDGAFKGQFTDCNSGKSCQKTVICEDSAKIYYKNAHDGFVEEDPTFFVEKMQLKEVGP